MTLFPVQASSAKAVQTVVVSAPRADPWPPERSPHLKRSTLQGQSVSKAHIFQTCEWALPICLGPPNDLFLGFSHLEIVL